MIAYPSTAADPSPDASTPPRAFLEALAASGPAAALGDAAATYAWLIGSWEAEVVDYTEDGPPLRKRGEWHFAWILEGRALGDVWIAPPRAARTPGGSPGPANRYGMTVRLYDPELGAWRITWFNPVTGAENRLTGRRVGDDLVHIGRDEDGNLMRWTFTDIQPDSFGWRGESSRDDGETWWLGAEFRLRRRSSPDGGAVEKVPPDPPRTSRWEWTDRPGLEALVLSRAGGGLLAESDILVVLDGTPTRITYRLFYDDDWRFSRGRLRATQGTEVREIELVREEGGEWRVDGAPRPDLAGCSDLDVMATPFTNTPPLRRLGLEPGETRSLQVAWLRLPELTVAPVRQEYRRLEGGEHPARFLYRNLESGFEGELTVDEHYLVVAYGPWRRIASGPAE